MDKIIFVSGVVLLAIGLVGGGKYWSQQRSGELITPEAAVEEVTTAEAEEDQRWTVNWQDKVYEFGWFEVDNMASLSLMVNLPESMHSTEIIETDGCQKLINGGFYDTNDRPLGWLVSEGEVKNKEINSRLLNGFMEIGKDNLAWMGSEKTTNEVRVGLQSGPLLIENGKVLPLAIANDEGRRRSVAILTSEDKLVFATIYQQNSLLIGPYLSDLPQVVEELAEKLGINVWAAMNLDGGTASAFYDGKLLLEEAKPIGSYWCVR